MASRTLFWAFLCAPLVPFAFLACRNESAEPVADSGVTDAGADVPETFVQPPDDTGPLVSCTLDNGSDPVAFCLQKQLILSAIDSAYVKALGMATSVDSTTDLPDQDGSGNTLHSVNDDVSFAALLSRYLQDAALYGDNEANLEVVSTLIPLVGTIETELTVQPASYDGTLYFDLRTLAAYLRSLNYIDDANKLDAAADSYGRAIYSTYYHPLSPPPPGGDAGVGDASTDAADATDAETGPVPIGDGILGTPSGSDFAYAPDQVASGAFVLVDLAQRNPADPNALAWQIAAESALTHIHDRARDATRPLYYASLVTSSGAADTPMPPSSSLPADTLLTDVQASVGLALVKLQSFVNANPGLTQLTSYPFEAQAEDLVKALNTAPALWDSTGTGYYSGFVPSTSTVLTDKPTGANARLLSVLHFAFLGGQGPDADQIIPLHAALVNTKPPLSSFVTVVTDQHGYFTSVPPSFDFSTADAGAPGTRSYVTRVFGVVAAALHDQLAKP